MESGPVEHPTIMGSSGVKYFSKMSSKLCIVFELGLWYYMEKEIFYKKKAHLIEGTFESYSAIFFARTSCTIVSLKTAFVFRVTRSS
jgi:hypothetical protein